MSRVLLVLPTLHDTKQQQNKIFQIRIVYVNYISESNQMQAKTNDCIL